MNHYKKKRVDYRWKVPSVIRIILSTIMIANKNLTETNPLAICSSVNACRWDCRRKSDWNKFVGYLLVDKCLSTDFMFRWQLCRWTSNGFSVGKSDNTKVHFLGFPSIIRDKNSVVNMSGIVHEIITKIPSAIRRLKKLFFKWLIKYIFNFNLNIKNLKQVKAKN